MIHIAVAIDQNYVQPLGVMLNSLLQHTTGEVKIHVVHANLRNQDFLLIDRLVACYARASVSYYPFKVKLSPEYKLRGHLTDVAYYVFFLPDILPVGIKKFLYLDPDMIVTGDIQDLWRMDLGSYLLAAVPVYPPCFHEKIVVKGEDYFNGGVLLINAAQWRNERVTETALRAVGELETYISRGVNQDVLNVIARGRWRKIPLRWNKCPEFYLKRGLDLYDKEEVVQARELPGVVHFTGPVKPWHYACNHPERDLYVLYKDGTPWQHEPLIGRNFLSFLSRHLPFFFTAWVAAKLAHTSFAKWIKRAAFK